MFLLLTELVGYLLLLGLFLSLLLRKGFFLFGEGLIELFGVLDVFLHGSDLLLEGIVVLLHLGKLLLLLFGLIQLGKLLLLFGLESLVDGALSEVFLHSSTLVHVIVGFLEVLSIIGLLSVVKVLLDLGDGLSGLRELVMSLHSLLLALGHGEFLLLSLDFELLHLSHAAWALGFSLLLDFLEVLFGFDELLLGESETLLGSLSLLLGFGGRKLLLSFEGLLFC